MNVQGNKIPKTKDKTGDFWFSFWFLVFLRQAFFVIDLGILELFVDQAGLDLTENSLPLPP